MDSGHLQRHDLFTGRGTRRDFLRVMGAVAGAVGLGAAPPAAVRAPRLTQDPFSWGAASGDPAPDGVVLWTRLAGAALEAAGAHRDEIPVRWEVAEDEGMRRIVRAGTAAARPRLGHAVHVEVEGLRPGRDYHYRFALGDATTPVGRTRTAPAPDARPARMRFAFASCQHWEHGLYTAYRHMAEEDLDLIVHLGDYIYEGARNPRVRAHEGPELRTLEQYRRRYETYRSDPLLRAAHLHAPWIVTWDDHEVDDNYAGTTSADRARADALLLRRAAAYQAYYEFMPLRRSSMPHGSHARLYRRLRFGDLATFDVLDTRQYRDDQACGDGRRRSCAEHVRPGRTLLGRAQREWLVRGFADRDTRWNVLAQQVLMARLRGPDARGPATWEMDMWDGYPEERRTVLAALADAGVPNPVVLTGDIHASWVADLHRDPDRPGTPVVATEFAGTSISSGGDGRPMDDAAARILGANPHLRFHDGQRGYVRVELARDLWRSDFRVVDRVTVPDAPVRTWASWVVEHGRLGAQPG